MPANNVSRETDSAHLRPLTGPQRTGDERQNCHQCTGPRNEPEETRAFQEQG